MSDDSAPPEVESAETKEAVRQAIRHAAPLRVVQAQRLAPNLTWAQFNEKVWRDTNNELDAHDRVLDMQEELSQCYMREGGVNNLRACQPLAHALAQAIRARAQE